MTSASWFRMKDQNGREYNLIGAGLHAVKYIGVNAGLKLGPYIPRVLIAGLALKVGIDLINGEYDGDVLSQTGASITDIIPFKSLDKVFDLNTYKGVAKLTLLGLTGTVYGEFYPKLIKEPHEKLKKYSTFAVDTSAKNTQERDERASRRESTGMI